MPRETPREPTDLVRAFLAAMEARDLATARSFLGEGFAMTFPGGVRMTTLEELVAFAAPRYRFVRKAYEGFEVVMSPTESELGPPMQDSTVSPPPCGEGPGVGVVQDETTGILLHDPHPSPDAVRVRSHLPHKGEGQEGGALPSADVNHKSVVYCFGTLSGEWPDGNAFSGIRFIDRFEIANGLLVRQDVWNDLAEIRSRAETSSLSTPRGAEE